MPPAWFLTRIMNELLKSLLGWNCSPKAVETQPWWCIRAATFVIPKTNVRKMFAYNWLQTVHYQPAADRTAAASLEIEWPGYLVTIKGNGVALHRVWQYITVGQPILVRVRQDRETLFSRGDAPRIDSIGIRITGALSQASKANALINGNN
jgi:hypothetical protein